MSFRHIPQFPPQPFSSWSDIDYTYFHPRPVSDQIHSSSFLNTTTRSLSSSPGSSGRDWPITPTTASNDHELFHHHHHSSSSPRSTASLSVSPVPRPSNTNTNNNNVVKVEPLDDSSSDGCFIMENPTFDKDPPKVASFVSSQALAPPTEVPLRATQAPKKMKGMMGVFRINPFAMHNGSEGKGTAPTVCWEPGPLEEEPMMFEFQLDLIGYASEDDVDPSTSTSTSSNNSEKETTIAAFDETLPFGEEGGVLPPVVQDSSSLNDRNIDPALKMSTLHAFSPEFDPQDEFSSTVGDGGSHSSDERYNRSSPSAIHHHHHHHPIALPEDQTQTTTASCNNTNPALLPQGDHRNSPFTLEYHNHNNNHHIHSRPPSSSTASSSSCTYGGGQWEFNTSAEQQRQQHQPSEVVGLDSTTTTAVDRCGIQIHHQHQDPSFHSSQGGCSGEEEDQQHQHHQHQHYRGRGGPYQHYHRPTVHQSSEASRDSSSVVVVPTASTSCSYGTLMVTEQTVHQQSPYTALQVDPEEYHHQHHHHQQQHSHHNVEVAVGGGGPTSSLGLYSMSSAAAATTAPATGYSSDTESLNHSHTSGDHYDASGMLNSAHISTAAATTTTVPTTTGVATGADDVSSGLRFPSRGSNPHHPATAVQYEYHHPYLRPTPIYSGDHNKFLGRYHRVSNGGCTSVYSDNGYSEEDGSSSSSNYIYPTEQTHQSSSSLIPSSSHCPSPDRLHNTTTITTTTTTSGGDTVLGPGRFWSRSYTAVPVLSATRAS